MLPWGRGCVSCGSGCQQHGNTPAAGEGQVWQGQSGHCNSICCHHTRANVKHCKCP